MIRICSYCGKWLKADNRRNKRNRTHINIAQNPQKHLFCCKDCKMKFIYAEVENNA